MSENQLTNNIGDIDITKDIKFFICNGTYIQLLTKYNNDTNPKEGTKTEEGNKTDWSLLANSIAICVHQNAENNNDSGGYEFVIFAPSGKPIKISTCISDFDKNYFSVTPTDETGGKTQNTTLSLNISEIGNAISGSKINWDFDRFDFDKIEQNDILNRVDQNIVKQDLDKDFNTTVISLMFRIVSLENRIKELENNVIYRSPAENSLPISYIWSGPIDGYDASKATSDTAYIISRTQK